MLSDAAFDYDTVFHHMTWDEIEEANAALDMQIEALENRRAEEQAKRHLQKLTGRR